MTEHSGEIAVTIVMPCLNEMDSLGYCIERAKQALQEIETRYQLRGEILISDNGSTDGSQGFAESKGAVVEHCTEKGYGNALRWGLSHAKGKYLIMADADGSYDFLQSPDMISKLLEGFDVCMGSRFLGEILPGAMPWKNRYLGNPILTGILNLFFRTGVSDAHCGLRAFTKEAIEKIAPTSNGMEFASELVIKAKMLGLSQTELPITLSPDKRDREPHLRPWRDGWRHLRYLIMLSPTWLFFLPALLTGLVGIGLFTALLVLDDTPGQVVTVFNLKVGDHWAIIAGGLINISHLSLVMGIAMVMEGIKSKYRRAQDYPTIIFKLCRLEYMLLLGTFSILVGLGILIYTLNVWSTNNFGGLHMIREMVLATTLCVVGVQNIFCGFLLSSLADNTNLIDAIEDLEALR